MIDHSPLLLLTFPKNAFSRKKSTKSHYYDFLYDHQFLYSQVWKKSLSQMAYRNTKKKLHSFSPYFFCLYAVSLPFLYYGKSMKNNFACFPRLLSLIYERVLLLQISVSLLFLFVQYFICQKMVRDFLMLSAVDMMLVECVNVNVQREFFITVLKYITLIWCTLTHVFNDKVRFENKPNVGMIAVWRNFSN